MHLDEKMATFRKFPLPHSLFHKHVPHPQAYVHTHRPAAPTPESPKTFYINHAPWEGEETHPKPTQSCDCLVPRRPAIGRSILTSACSLQEAHVGYQDVDKMQMALAVVRCACALKRWMVFSAVRPTWTSQ